MSTIQHLVQALVARGEYLISRHGFRELLADDILIEDVLTGVAQVLPVEDYPSSRKEPAVLVGHSKDRGNACGPGNSVSASA